MSVPPCTVSGPPPPRPRRSPPPSVSNPPTVCRSSTGQTDLFPFDKGDHRLPAIDGVGPPPSVSSVPSVPVVTSTPYGDCPHRGPRRGPPTRKPDPTDSTLRPCLGPGTPSTPPCHEPSRGSSLTSLTTGPTTLTRVGPRVPGLGGLYRSPPRGRGTRRGRGRPGVDRRRVIGQEIRNPGDHGPLPVPDPVRDTTPTSRGPTPTS